MLIVKPSFYDRFACRAARCVHSCCVGWEIDVDPGTMELYHTLEGPLGDEIREKIRPLPEPHFILQDDGRCPFLNDGGLCRIILGCGEEALCDICAEHPRFYNCFPGREEAGLGLCCEETVELLLGGESFTLIEDDDGEGDDPDRWVEQLASLRDVLFSYLRDGEGDFSGRIDRALSAADTEFPPFEPAVCAQQLLGLERMDDRWREMLEYLRDSGAGVECRLPLDDPRYERILRYFLYRHLITAKDEEDVRRLLRFCVLGMLTVCALDVVDPERKDEHLRLWSAEIEYSDENISRICTWL